MQCEICGGYIEKGKRVRVEGSIVITCDKCSSYGEVIGDVKTHEERKKVKTETVPLEKGIELEIETKEDLVDDYPRLIREAREKRGMTQKDLAKYINESTSIVHRIESGKLKPDPIITRKIQSKLGIKLFEKSTDFEVQGIKTRSSDELTLGDLVVVRKRKSK